ncbi:hypothetical protein [Pseudomonas sp. NPDC090592]|uniref:hypothetical protein n=1 Tax=Pseudomonas sp. NPDC090592 TaxID=3364480 RepID=UPI00383B7E1E
MNNQIRMITGIGTPIIHSNIERMLFSFCQKSEGQPTPPLLQSMHEQRNQDDDRNRYANHPQ